MMNIYVSDSGSPADMIAVGGAQRICAFGSSGIKLEVVRNPNDAGQIKLDALFTNQAQGTFQIVTRDETESIVTFSFDGRITQSLLTYEFNRDQLGTVTVEILGSIVRERNDVPLARISDMDEIDATDLAGSERAFARELGAPRDAANKPKTPLITEGMFEAGVRAMLADRNASAADQLRTALLAMGFKQVAY